MDKSRELKMAANNEKEAISAKVDRSIVKTAGAILYKKHELESFLLSWFTKFTRKLSNNIQCQSNLRAEA